MITQGRWVYFLAAKGEAFSKLCEWKKLVENQVKKKVCCLRTYNGLEFFNTKFDSFCKHHGIQRHKTCAYTPQQNGVAELMNKTLMEKVKCLLVELGLEEQFWAEAVSTSAYVTNMSPSSAIDGNIPEELWLGKKPDYLHLRKFGFVVYIHADQGKLKARAKKGIFVSYPSGVKGYKVWLLEETKCVISRNVLFAEDKVYKDLSVYEVKADVTATLRNQTMLGETAGSASGPEVEPSGGAVDETAEVPVDAYDEQGESLEGYQLVRDRVRRKIMTPARYPDSEDITAFLLYVDDDVCAEEP